MAQENIGILLVQSDLNKIVSMSEKCISAGIDDETIYATVYGEDIQKFLMGKGIGTVIIDADMYNMESASILKTYSSLSDLDVILVTKTSMRKTIRMIMDENLKYINAEISSEDLAKVLGIYQPFWFKKVVHL